MVKYLCKQLNSIIQQLIEKVAEFKFKISDQPWKKTDFNVI